MRKSAVADFCYTKRYMKIALLSDSHNSWKDLRKAVQVAGSRGCEVLFFAGDLVRPDGVNVLATFSGPVHMIIGNNEFEIDDIWARAEDSDNVIYHGEVCDIERKGLRIFMHHYPQEAVAKAQSGIYDLCIHGHTHAYQNRMISETPAVNPGAISDRGSKPAWAIYDTETGELERQET